MTLSADNKKRRDSEVVDGNFRPAGYEQITSLSSAAALTIPLHARVALFTVTGQSVRWRDDGTAPEAGTGMPLAVDQPFWYNGDLAAFRAIEVAPSATLNVAYYG